MKDLKLNAMRRKRKKMEMNSLKNWRIMDAE